MQKAKKVYLLYLKTYTFFPRNLYLFTPKTYTFLTTLSILCVSVSAVTPCGLFRLFVSLHVHYNKTCNYGKGNIG